MALGLVLMSAAPMAWLESLPGDGHTLAAIYAPWIGADRAVNRAAQAGGAVVRLGLLGSIVVVHDETQGLSDRLSASGAWAVIDPQFLGGCLTQGI